jgi:hypothetical protein
MIRNYSKDLKFWRKLKGGEIAKGEVESIRETHPEVERLENLMKIDEDTLKARSLWKGKGHPTETRNRIAAVFAQVIKKENGDHDWVVIDSLILWIWQRIKRAIYSKELVDVNPVFTPETLKVAHAKFIKNPEKNLDIKRQVEHCFSSLIARPWLMIKFQKKFITYDSLEEDQESRYSTIIFPDGEILEGRFNLEEAAAFLDVPPLFLERLCEKELVPCLSRYWRSSDEDGKELTFSRVDLQKWKKEMVGDGPILKVTGN